MSTRILYIEDNHLNMRLVRKILRHAGYDMIEAENGVTGLDMAKSEQPSLILVDINLPDIDGLELATRFKASPELSSVPVIALTANAMVGDREKYLAAGCDSYLSKPISKTDLLATIERFLKISQQ